MGLISQRISISDGMIIVIQLICERDRFQRVLGVAPTNHNFFFRWGCWVTASRNPRCIWNNLLEIIFEFLILSSCVFFPNAAILSVCTIPGLCHRMVRQRDIDKIWEIFYICFCLKEEGWQWEKVQNGAREKCRNTSFSPTAVEGDSSQFVQSWNSKFVLYLAVYQAG